MAAPSDLSKLRIDRDAPSAPVRKALVRNLLLFVAAIVLAGAAAMFMRARSVPTVQGVTASADAGGGGGGATRGPASVTAHGYIGPPKEALNGRGPACTPRTPVT